MSEGVQLFDGINYEEPTTYIVCDKFNGESVTDYSIEITLNFYERGISMVDITKGNNGIELGDDFSGNFSSSVF